MEILRLDHVNIKTNRLTEMVAFYEDVLGMKSGKRPNFPSHGAWIYVGKNPVIHLVEMAHECASVEPKIEHFALQAIGLKNLLETLVERKVEYTLDPVPGLSVIQVNLTDVDGNHIHIDFNSTETEFLN